MNPDCITFVSRIGFFNRPADKTTILFLLLGLTSVDGPIKPYYSDPDSQG